MVNSRDIAGDAEEEEVHLPSWGSPWDGRIDWLGVKHQQLTSKQSVLRAFPLPFTFYLGFVHPLQDLDRFVGLVVKASASRAEDPGFESRLRRDFSGVESYQWLAYCPSFFLYVRPTFVSVCILSCQLSLLLFSWLKNWHSSGYPARRLTL